MAAVSVIKKLQRWERIQNGTREEYYPLVTYKIKIKECASSNPSSPPPPSTMLSVNSSCSLPLTASSSTRALADLTDSVLHSDLSTSLHQSGPTRSFPLRSPLKLERESPQRQLAADQSCNRRGSSNIGSVPCCKLQRGVKERVLFGRCEEEEGMWAMFPWKLELQEAEEEDGVPTKTASGGGMQLQPTSSQVEGREEEKEEAAALVTKEMDRKKRKEWEVERVECECCGMEEDCTRGYEERVKRGLCGHFLCGLCEEAVREEHKWLGGRAAGGEVSLQAALQAHMQPCRGFSSRARTKASPPPSAVTVPHAVCRLLRRHLSTRAPSPPPGPYLPRSSSCLPSFHRNMHHHPTPSTQ